jgi:hypothetical protein
LWAAISIPSQPASRARRAASAKFRTTCSISSTVIAIVRLP